VVSFTLRSLYKQKESSVLVVQVAGSAQEPMGLGGKREMSAYTGNRTPAALNCSLIKLSRLMNEYTRLYPKVSVLSR
jgi:hypothetical protein